MSFAGKIVVITGAAGIYGRQFSKAFGREGATLVLTDRKAAGLNALARELALPGERLRLLPADLADDAAIADFVAEVGRSAGCPDIVVNNAGIYPFGGLLDTSSAMWDDIMAINLKAPFLLTQGFARLMIEKSIKGSIVCVSSGAAHVLRINGLAYSVGSTQASFPPGYVENMSARIPLGRMAGEHEAADAILFLCSDKASYITGAAIPVDGGSAIPRRALSPTTKKETT